MHSWRRKITSTVKFCPVFHKMEYKLDIKGYVADHIFKTGVLREKEQGNVFMPVFHM